MKGEGKELTDFALMFTAGAAAGLYICSGNRLSQKVERTDNGNRHAIDYG